jgi:hypothetical protein
MTSIETVKQDFGSSELNKGSAFGFKIPLQTYKRSSSSL